MMLPRVWSSTPSSSRDSGTGIIILSSLASCLSPEVSRPLLVLMTIDPSHFRLSTPPPPAHTAHAHPGLHHHSKLQRGRGHLEGISPPCSVTGHLYGLSQELQHGLPHNGCTAFGVYSPSLRWTAQRRRGVSEISVSVPLHVRGKDSQRRRRTDD